MGLSIEYKEEYDLHSNEKPTIVVSGSLVHDLIKVIGQRFKDCILPECLHILNVSFSVNSQEISWGGTGGNIAYNLGLLSGGDIVLVAAIGRDGQEYLGELRKVGVNTDHVYVDPVKSSAACDLITDIDNNQMNTYYPGPADMAGNISDVDGRACLAIISPSTKDVMIRHLQECTHLGIEAFFDPGQQITSFGKEELICAFENCALVFGNDNEIRSMMLRSGWDKACLINRGKTIVTTFGGEGCLVENASAGEIMISACGDIKVKDPTGAGDAFRAGFMFGYVRGFNLETCARLGSVIASFAVEALGTQNHRFDPKSFIKRYEDNYGSFPGGLIRELKGLWNKK